MATSRQVVQIIARGLLIPEGRLTWSADTLRRHGLLPSGQGQALPLDWSDVALLLIAAIGGPPIANNAERMRRYALTVDQAGIPLQVAMETRLQHGGLVRLSIDLASPGATAIESGHVRHFAEPGNDVAAFDRVASISGDTLDRIAHAIRNAPPYRAGRPSNKEAHVY